MKTKIIIYFSPYAFKSKMTNPITFNKYAHKMVFFFSSK